MKTKAVAAALMLAAALLCGGRLRVPFGEELFFSREGKDLPPASDCERCHQEVYQEWRDSLHARAWRSEAFQRASAGRRAEECLGCHAPGPLDAQQRPALRDAHREEGVTCVSCHLAPGSAGERLTMRGPVSRSSPIEVHPVIEADPSYRSSELCGTCHRETFAEWSRSAAREGKEEDTCQGCHMPAVRRTVESVHDERAYSRVLVALEREEDLRRHLFAVVDDPSERVELEARRAADGRSVEATIANRLPHALPTGQFGRRQVALDVVWPGGNRRTAVVDSPARALSSGEQRRVTLELPPEALAAPLRVFLLRFDHALGEWSEITSTAVASPAH
jgi:Cytochrome c554 and c-prime